MQKDPAKVSHYFKKTTNCHANQKPPRTIANALIQLSEPEDCKDRKIGCIACQGGDIFNKCPINGTGA